MEYGYSHTYEDPELIEVMVPVDDDLDDDDEGDDAGGLRNARRRSHRSRSSRGRRTRRTDRPRSRGTIRRRTGRYQPQLPERVEHGGPVVARDPDGEYFAIKKSAIADLLPAVGMVWASFLGTPQAPRATGDDITDRDNASSHRESLAQHQQNQTRILALTELAGRALAVFTN